jgi:hypothetical protein
MQRNTLRRVGDILDDENEVFSDHCSEGSESADFVPNDYTICMNPENWMKLTAC